MFLNMAASSFSAKVDGRRYDEGGRRLTAGVNGIGDSYPDGLDAKPPRQAWSRPVEPRMLLLNKTS